MAMETFQTGDPNEDERMRSLFGPQQVDQQIRQAIQFCWMALPQEKKNVDEVEKQIRRLVDRAMRDLREDTDAFGLGELGG